MVNLNLTVNGNLTQGENIADNGGLKGAFLVWINIWLFLFEFYVYRHINNGHKIIDIRRKN
jgi:hypothetical protein